MKNKNINGILCSYLKLIPYQGGLLAVSETEIKKGNLRYDNDYESVGTCMNAEEEKYLNANKQRYFLVLAATQHLALPVWELPEKEHIAGEATRQGLNFSESFGEQLAFSKGYVAGYRAAGKSYSEEDMMNYASFVLSNRKSLSLRYENSAKDVKDFWEKTFKDFLLSIQPKGAWCQVEQINEFAHLGGAAEYKFKITNNKLTVVEWE